MRRTAPLRLHSWHCIDELYLDLCENGLGLWRRLYASPFCVCGVGPVTGEAVGGNRDGIPFVIEWIPDILPQSHVGELRIQFEFGHQYNGVVQHRPPIVATPGDVSVRQIAALSTSGR